MKSIRCGVIGLGRIGRIHLENLIQGISGAEVIAVSDPSPEAKAYAAKLGVREVFDHAESIISHGEVDAVIICSPTDTHASYIKKAVQSQKAIFCEKPLDLDLESIREIIRVVDSNTAFVMTGFNRRFDPGFARAQQAVRDRQLGQLQLLRISSRDPAPPPLDYIRSSGGIFLDMTIHDFDMARFVTNSEVTQVYTQAMAFHETIKQANDVDTAVITLQFENGMIAAIDNSRKAVYGYDQRLEIFGSEGMIILGNEHVDNHTFFNHQGANRPPLLNFFLERYQQAYINEMQAFIDALRRGDQPPVTVYDGYMAAVIAVAAKQSWLERRPVEIKEITEDD